MLQFDLDISKSVSPIRNLLLIDLVIHVLFLMVGMTYKLIELGADFVYWENHDIVDPWLQLKHVSHFEAPVYCITVIVLFYLYRKEE